MNVKRTLLMMVTVVLPTSLAVMAVTMRMDDGILSCSVVAVTMLMDAGILLCSVGGFPFHRPAPLPPHRAPPDHHPCPLPSSSSSLSSLPSSPVSVLPSQRRLTSTTTAKLRMPTMM